ncbi:RsfA family transcriptional regulator [Alicyclobacillus macrosporangiidus]|uniref:Transcription factor, RsfA family n=1 Tax=Alicyclobacillus macrosporangiidus TaxID=392015 RepID=A0A1I7K2M2_9BACL|nr:RsfA family transcriptional regulator [Alicyclobacillus macrosporangiidus]SFU91615.1 transcription factor, RsfA family [Alicyclobacillus macrosporangiidus]
MTSAEKWITRSDAWTPEDDERLAAIVLQHIRTGSTQLRAFDQAAAELGRTAAACGYRWNGVLRKHRREEIEAAKQERKAAQKSASTRTGGSSAGRSHAVTATSSSSMREVILFLQTYDEQYQHLRRQVAQLEQEKGQLEQRVQELEALLQRQPALENGPLTPEQLAEDSRTLFAIMERARKLLEADANKATE